MKTIEKIAKELVGQNVRDVIEIFEDYEYEGVTEIVVNESSNGYDYIAYANHVDAPQVLMNVDNQGIITDALIV